MRKKFAYSLIELMLVIFLITIFFSLISFSVVKWIKKETFPTSAKIVLERIHIARNLASHLDTDIFLKLEQKEKSIVCKIFSNAPLNDKGLNFIKKDLEIEGIEAIHFDAKKLEFLEIKFSSNGYIYPKGCLQLSSDASGKQEKNITIRWPYTSFEINNSKLLKHVQEASPDDFYPQEICLKKKREIYL